MASFLFAEKNSKSCRMKQNKKKRHTHTIIIIKEENNNNKKTNQRRHEKRHDEERKYIDPRILKHPQEVNPRHTDWTR